MDTRFFEENQKGCNAVAGISGGKDSSVTAALCAEVLDKDRVIGILMPCGEQHNIECAKQLAAHFSIEHYIVNIKSVVDGLLGALSKDMEILPQTKTNLSARICMSALYAISHSNNGCIADTYNLSEDWVGYATGYGDSAGDFISLSQFTVAEAKAVGYVLNLPQNLIEKTPIDGLCGKTDEGNLGFTYAVLDYYMNLQIRLSIILPIRATDNSYRKLKSFIITSKYSTIQKSLYGKKKRYSTSKCHTANTKS